MISTDRYHAALIPLLAALTDVSRAMVLEVELFDAETTSDDNITNIQHAELEDREIVRHLDAMGGYADPPAELRINKLMRLLTLIATRSARTEQLARIRELKKSTEEVSLKS